MKKSVQIENLDELIERASNLKYVFNNFPQTPIINDALSFIRNTMTEEKNLAVWVNRINDIYWGVSSSNSAETEQVRFTRWHNGKDKFIGILKSIKRETELFTSDDTDSTSGADNTAVNVPVIFLSHSSTDKSYGDALEKFITGLGVKREQLIYTSHPMHIIPLDEDIYEYLKKNINRKVFMIFLWSDAFLDSPSCLMEMGAAWVIQSDYTNIFTPDFNFNNPKYLACAVNIRKMGIILNGDDRCKISMIELKEKIVSLFKLSVDEKLTSHLISEFIKDISNNMTTSK
jgi:hypothetical protein